MPSALGHGLRTRTNSTRYHLEEVFPVSLLTVRSAICLSCHPSLNIHVDSSLKHQNNGGCLWSRGWTVAGVLCSRPGGTERLFMCPESPGTEPGTAPRTGQATSGLHRRRHVTCLHRCVRAYTHMLKAKRVKPCVCDKHNASFTAHTTCEDGESLPELDSALDPSGSPTTLPRTN